MLKYELSSIEDIKCCAQVVDSKLGKKILRWRNPLKIKNNRNIYQTCTVRDIRLSLLVSTYVVCERLSVMHEPAGVVENLVQILQNTPILQYRIPPPPPKMKIVRNLGTLTFQLQNTPPPPTPKIDI